MRLIYAHTILRTLMWIAAEGNGMIVETSLGGKVLKLNNIALSQHENDWQLPKTGILLTRFMWLKECLIDRLLPPPPTPMTIIASETILDILIGDLRPVDQNVFLKAAFSGRNVSKEQLLRTNTHLCLPSQLGV